MIRYYAVHYKTPKQALNPAFLKQKPEREEIELFKKEFICLLDNINEKESEEFHKNIITDFLNSAYYKDKHYNIHTLILMVLLYLVV